MRLIYQFLELPWETMLAIIAAGLSLLAFGLYLLVQLCLNPVIILTIVLKSLRQHALSTAITAASIGLGCGLLMGVLVVSDRSEALHQANVGSRQPSTIGSSSCWLLVSTWDRKSLVPLFNADHAP